METHTLTYFRQLRATLAISYALALLLWAPTPLAHAESRSDFIQASPSKDDNDPTSINRVYFISASECITALQPLASPLATIKDGMNALLDPQLSADSNVSCASDILQNWNDLHGIKPAEPKPDPASSFMQAAHVTDPEAKAIEAKMECFISFYVPGTPEYAASQESKQEACQGQWLNADQHAKLAAKLAARMAVISAKQTEETIAPYLAQQWSSYTAGNYKDKNGLTLDTANKCNNSFTPGTPAHAQKIAEDGASCGGSFLDKEGYEKFMAGYFSAASPLYEQSAEFSEYFTDLKTQNPKALVFEMGKQLSCFLPEFDTPEELEKRRKAYAGICGSFGVRPGSERKAFQADLNTKLVALLKDLPRWRKERERKIVKLRSAHEKAHPSHYPDYGTRRLLALFENHVAKGGKAEELPPSARPTKRPRSAIAAMLPMAFNTFHSAARRIGRAPRRLA